MTFDIDANGIVQVSAKDKATNKEQQIRIQASGGLGEAEIQKMVKDAELHAEEDKKKRELIDARNGGEALAHSTEKHLAEYGDKVGATEKAEIESALAALKAALTGEDAEDIKSKTNALTQVAMKLGEAMYKAQQAEARRMPGPAVRRRAGRRGGRREGRRRRVRGRHRQQEKDRFGIVTRQTRTTTTDLPPHRGRSAIVEASGGCVRRYGARFLRAARLRAHSQSGRHQEGIPQACHAASP